MNGLKSTQHVALNFLSLKLKLYTEMQVMMTKRNIKKTINIEIKINFYLSFEHHFLYNFKHI